MHPNPSDFIFCPIPQTSPRIVFFPESEQVPAIIQPAISLYLNLHTTTTGLSSGCNFAAISFNFPFNLPFSNAFIKASAP